LADVYLPANVVTVCFLSVGIGLAFSGNTDLLIKVFSDPESNKTFSILRDWQQPIVCAIAIDTGVVGGRALGSGT
jgi:hypothetical protein